MTHSQQRRSRGRPHPAVASTRIAVRRTLSPQAGHDGVSLSPSPGDTVVVALSGGADSLALAAAVAFEAPKLQLRSCAVTVDHRLQDGSAEVAQQARQQARTLGFSDAEIVTVTVTDSGQGLEADAREARYSALVDTAARRVRSGAGRAWILTAHTRDDQAEQVLLGLVRGSGTRSLAGIAPLRSVPDHPEITIARPFLDVPREVTEAACVAQQLSWWDDPHNTDESFLRVRARARALPRLTATLDDALGVTLRENLARTAKLAREDADALDEIAHTAYFGSAERTDYGVTLPVAALAQLPDAVLSRVLRVAAGEVGGSAPDFGHTQEIVQLVRNWRGQGEINLPGVAVSRKADALSFRAFSGNPRLDRCRLERTKTTEAEEP